MLQPFNEMPNSHPHLGDKIADYFSIQVEYNTTTVDYQGTFNQAIQMWMTEIKPNG